MAGTRNPLQFIQQVRAGNTPVTENATPAAKTAVDAIVAKLNPENSSGSGNLQNGDNNGTSKNTSEGPRNFTGLASDRLETLATLISPDKASNAQTNPLLAKLSATPLTNLSATGQPAVSWGETW